MKFLPFSVVKDYLTFRLQMLNFYLSLWSNITWLLNYKCKIFTFLRGHKWSRTAPQYLSSWTGGPTIRYWPHIFLPLKKTIRYWPHIVDFFRETSGLNCGALYHESSLRLTCRLDSDWIQIDCEECGETSLPVTSKQGEYMVEIALDG